MTRKEGSIASVRRPSNVCKSATLASLSDKGPTVRVNFDLDRDEHRRLKMMAVEQGRTVTEILRGLIAERLNKVPNAETQAAMEEARGIMKARNR